MELNIRPPLPQRRDFRIGILGSGFIVNDCHLVAYRKAGFNPVAIASQTFERATAAAARERRTVKGILAQKPLAMNYAEALEAVTACEEAGISLAVNQNMRYDQSV